MDFTTTILAVLIADIILLFTLKVLDMRLTLRDLPFFFSQTEYSYLVIVNNCAIHMLEMGATQEEVASKLPHVPFVFKTKQSNNPKSIKAKQFVDEVLSDRNLVMTYLVNYGFDKDSFARLCSDISKSNDKKVAIRLINDLFIPLTIETDTTIDLIAQWQAQPYLAKQLAKEAEYKVTKGRHQLILFEAMKGSVLKPDVKQKDFANLMKTIGRLNKQMNPVTDSAMSQQVLSDDDKVILKMVQKEIVNRLLGSKGKKNSI